MSIKKFLFFLLAIAIIGGLFFVYKSLSPSPTSKDPNDISRTYSIQDFPAQNANDSRALSLIDRLNKDLKALREGTVDDGYVTWVDIGNIKVGLKDFQGSKAAYEKAIEIRDFAVLAYLNMGTLYKMHLADYQKAEQYYLEALSRIDGTTNVAFFSDYESFADLYVNYYKEKNVDIEKLMLEGADKSVSINKIPYYNYLYKYFIETNPSKSNTYKEKILSLDPSYTFE